MPCDGSHCEPTRVEAETQLVCQLICVLAPRLNLNVPAYAAKASRSIYGAGANVDSATQRLCRLCEQADPDIIYANARDKDMRPVATWWEAHQERDRMKAQRVKEKDRDSLLRRMARNAEMLPDDQIAQVIQFAIDLRSQLKVRPASGKAPRANSNKAGG